MKVTLPHLHTFIIDENEENEEEEEEEEEE